MTVHGYKKNNNNLVIDKLLIYNNLVFYTFKFVTIEI